MAKKLRDGRDARAKVIRRVDAPQRIRHALHAPALTKKLIARCMAQSDFIRVDPSRWVSEVRFAALKYLDRAGKAKYSIEPNR